VFPLDPCCGILVSAIPCIGISRIVLAPAFHAAKSGQRGAHYYVTDLAVLVTYISLSLGLAYTPWADAFYAEGHFVLLTSLVLLSACLWWIGVRTLSQAGVINARRRLAFLMVVPLVYVSAATVIPLAFFTVLGVIALADGHVIGFPYFVILVGVPAVIASFVAGRLIAGRIFQAPGPPSHP
jgi:hypothetical protein